MCVVEEKEVTATGSDDEWKTRKGDPPTTSYTKLFMIVRLW